MSKPKKMPPTFFPREWVPLKAVLRRIISITESRDDALRSLNRDLRSGRLRSALLEISSDDKETMTLLNPSEWQQRTVKATINPEESVYVEPYVAGPRYFVRRADLNKWYPTTAANQSDDTESSPPTTPAPEKQKPGIKPFKDWPNRLLAPEMVRIAYETPDLLWDRSKLVRHVRKTLKEEIGWEPADNKPIYRELNRLLSRLK